MSPRGFLVVWCEVLAYLAGIAGIAGLAHVAWHFVSKWW